MFDAGTLLALLAALTAVFGARLKGAAPLWAAAVLGLAGLAVRWAGGTDSPASLPCVLLAAACGAAVVAARSDLALRPTLARVAAALALGGLGLGWSPAHVSTPGALAHALSGLVFAACVGGALALRIANGDRFERLVLASAAMLAPFAPAGAGLVVAPGGALQLIGPVGDASTVVRAGPLELDPAGVCWLIGAAQALTLLSVFVLLLRGGALSVQARRIAAVLAPALLFGAVVWAAVDAMGVWRGTQAGLRPASDLLLSGQIGRGIATLDVRQGTITGMDLGRATFALARAGLAALCLWPRDGSPEPAPTPTRVFVWMGLALVTTGLAGAFLGREAWGNAWALDPAALSAGAALLLTAGAARSIGGSSQAAGRWLPVAAVLACWWALIGAQVGWSLASWHPPL